MNLHELSPAAGSTQVGKRKGRGAGTGNGKTAGRGHKGQKARSGGGVRVGFEGGQMPLARRVPKRGFNNIFAKPLEIINLSALNAFNDGDVVTAQALLERGILSKCPYGYKVLGNGKITKKVTVQASAFSTSAREAIEAAGGKAEVKYHAPHHSQSVGYPRAAEKDPVYFADSGYLPYWKRHPCPLCERADAGAVPAGHGDHHPGAV